MNNNLSDDEQREYVRAGAFRQLELGHATAARTAFKALIAADPRDAAAYCGLGRALESLGSKKKAFRAYRQALIIDPDRFDALHQSGRLLITLDRPGNAVAILEKAVAGKPGSDAAWCDLGSALTGIYQLDKAEESLRHAIDLNPRLSVAYHNLGLCLRFLGRLDESILAFQKALAIDPEMAATVAAHAATLADSFKINEAIEHLDRFLARHPKNAECYQNRALILLRAGRLHEGFEDYEWRFTPATISVPTRPFVQNRWQGDPLNTRSLLVWLEQGIGDELLSLSLAGDILKRAPNCSIECDARLLPILERSFPSARIVPRCNPPDPKTKSADLVCPALSAARFLRQSFDDFPRHHGYLKADPDKIGEIRERYLSLAQGRKIVGLSWGSASRSGRLKTPPLEIWETLLQNDAFFFVSLQYTGAKEDAETLFNLSGTHVFVESEIDPTSDIDFTAAQISALDAVVTISNSSAHLAGALGCPVATLIPEGHGGFWYWFRGRTDSPWYPSMHLCRQAEQGHWASTIVDVQKWLSQLFDG